MSPRAVRIVMLAIGVVLVLIGLVWAGQGSGILPGTVMSGDPKWLVIGLVLVVIGAVLIVLGLRRRGSQTPSS
jgi:hypothetical protein